MVLFAFAPFVHFLGDLRRVGEQAFWFLVEPFARDVHFESAHVAVNENHVWLIGELHHLQQIP